MLRWALFVVLGLVGLVCIVAVVGWMLPKEHRASRTATLPAAPEAVFAVITDFANAPAWRHDVKAVDMLPPRNGATMFRERGGQGPITYRVEAVDPPRRLVTRIADPSLPFGGTWTFELEAQGDGTALTITEDGEVYNPIFRFMSKFVFSPTATIETYQSELARRMK